LTTELLRSGQDVKDFFVDMHTVVPLFPINEDTYISINCSCRKC